MFMSDRRPRVRCQFARLLGLAVTLSTVLGDAPVPQRLPSNGIRPNPAIVRRDVQAILDGMQQVRLWLEDWHDWQDLE